MAFKVVPVRDSFLTNLLSNWQFLEQYPLWLLESGQVHVEAKRLTFPTTEPTRLHYNVVYEPDQEVWAEFQLPEAGKEAGLDVRYANEQCYSMVIKGTGEIVVYKEVKGVRTELLKLSGLTLENKDYLGFVAEGSKLTVWRQVKGEGAVAQIGTVEDISITQEGQVGVFSDNTKTKIDEFAAGSLHEAEPTINEPEERGGRAFTELTPVMITGTRLDKIAVTGLHAGLVLYKVSDTLWEIVGEASELGFKTVTLEPKNANTAAGSNTSFVIKIFSPLEVGTVLNTPADQTSTVSTALPTLKITGARLATMAVEGLPAGLTLTKVSQTEWTITGTPTLAKAAVTVTLKAKNAEAAGESIKTFKWTVVESAEPAGAFKFRSAASTAVRVLSTAGNKDVDAAVSPAGAYGTNDPNIAFVLRNATAHVVPW